MRPKPEKPESRKERGPGGTIRETETHPAYGMVGIRRTTGSIKLYGSALDKHGSFIEIIVREAERQHDLGRDWHASGKILVQAAVSQAQFAELITTPNVGHGVPCTLQFVTDRGHVPPIDMDTETEARKVVEGFQESLEDLSERLKEKAGQLEKILAKKSVGKEDRRRIRELFGFVRQEVDANMPYAVEAFQEAAEKVVAQGKAELDAMIASVVGRLGFESLGQLASAASGAPALAEGKKE